MGAGRSRFRRVPLVSAVLSTSVDNVKLLVPGRKWSGKKLGAEQSPVVALDSIFPLFVRKLV